MNRSTVYTGTLEETVTITLPEEIAIHSNEMVGEIHMVVGDHIVDAGELGCEVEIDENTVIAHGPTDSPLPSDHAIKVVVVWGEGDRSVESELGGLESENSEE